VIAAAELASYDSTKHYLLRSLNFENNIWVHIMSSGMAGICGAVAATPLDVVKVQFV